MKKTIEFNGIEVTVYKSEAPSDIVVYSNDGGGDTEEIVNNCKEIGTSPFHYVSITRFDWDAAMSPWKHEPVVSKNDNFAGKADEHLCLIEKKVLPAAEEIIGENTRKRVIAGYSMAGLFAAYAPFRTEIFNGFICASGSVWYPDFKEFFIDNEFAKIPETAYFSIGDKEKKTRNSYLRTTENLMRELCDNAKNRGIKTSFSLNPGNHFNEMPLRLAKGIDWTVRELAGAAG